MKQMQMPLPTLHAECDRHGVPNRTAAFIAATALQNKRKGSQENESKAIDRSKVGRERAKKSEELTGDSIPTFSARLYFDGRKDRTIVPETIKPMTS